MPTTRRVKSSRERVQVHRQRLRKQGLRPIQIWVSDVRSKAFVREAHRQSRLVARSPQEAEDQKFVDAISEWSDADVWRWDDAHGRIKRTPFSVNRSM